MASRTKTGGPLQRGSACLCCRKKKLKCDGTRPVCRQCIKMNRHDECEYDNKRQESRTQKLRAKLSMLEERVRELEFDHTGSDSSPSTSDGLPSYARSPSVDISLSGEPFPIVGSPSMSNLEAFVSTTFLPATSDGFDSWSPGPSSMPLSNSIYMPPYVQETSNAFSQNEYVAPSFLGSSLGMSASHQPLAHESISAGNKRLLFDIFLSHRHQFGFDSHTDRFQVCSQAPPNEQPHPALMNAIYLLACYFSEFEWTSELEPKLLSEACLGITSALGQSDRLVDIVQASCLIAVYLYANHRVLEGYRHAFQAAKLAVGLKLHQISADFHDHPPHKSGTLEQVATRSIPPPRDLMELDDRICAFWQVFMVDRCWSVANGLPVALPHGNAIQFRVKTPWPQPITEQMFHRDGDEVDRDTIRDFIQNPNPTSTAFTPAFRAKAAALYEHTFRLASVTPKNDAYWAEHRSAVVAVQQFAATLPVFVGYEAWRPQPQAVDVSLFAVHTMVHVARLHLHKDAQETLRIATAVVALVRQLNDGDYKYLDPIMSSCWYCVGKIYIRILASASQNSQGEVPEGPLNAIEQALDVLTNALQTLSTFFLLADDYTKRLKQERVEVHANLQ